jgi:3-phenylpropionate/trans-cinnamate dioxygenase ferredoxin reductase subunit
VLSSVTVVGSSLAGVTAAQALRARGYDGSLVVVGDEPHRPYDRPPLSKGYLAGTTPVEELALLDGDQERDLDVRWRLGARAVRLDPADRAVVLGTGERLVADGVVLATGAHPRRLSGSAGLQGVHHLRTLDDATALRAALASGGPRVVVVGAGFVGAEVAATARGLGLHVEVVEALAVPLAPTLGPAMGAAVAALHADHGVVVHAGAGVARLLADGPRVRGVELADGRVLAADVVVVGIGVVPATDWLLGSGVELQDGVVCDARCRTALPGVVAAGDVARAVHGWSGTHLRLEHWSNAAEQPVIAAAALLGDPAPPAPAGPPSFWSDQYGVRIQFAGQVAPGDVLEVVEGDVDARSFAALWRRAGEPVAVLALARPRSFGRLRRTLRAPAARAA